MPRTIRIDNIPDSLYRALKTQSAAAGMSLSDYLLSELQQIAPQPTLKEFQRCLDTPCPVYLPESAAKAVRSERDSR